WRTIRSQPSAGGHVPFNRSRRASAPATSVAAWRPNIGKKRSSLGMRAWNHLSMWASAGLADSCQIPGGQGRAAGALCPIIPEAQTDRGERSMEAEILAVSGVETAIDGAHEIVGAIAE